MTIDTFTAADLGILAAALDDARNEGLGDGDIIDAIARAAWSQGVCEEADADSCAFDFYATSWPRI
jgi:hypothetical protein